MKIEILQGISCSGKTTYSKLKGWSIVSRDELRRQLLIKNDLNLQDYFEEGMEFKVEEYITRQEHKQIAQHIIKGHNLVIDNTCLHKKYVDEYVNIFNDLNVNPKDVSIIRFDVPIQLCLNRSKERDLKPINEDVLKNQYDRFKSIQWTIKDFIKDGKWKTTRDKKIWHYVDFDLIKERMNSKNKKAIICDLDGTFAHRRLLTNPIHFRSYYTGEECETDIADIEVYQMICAFITYGYKILFVSGRHENTKQKTKKFLSQYIASNYYELFMREDGDNRSDSIVKYEIFKNYIEPNYYAKIVIDDRDRVCSMWRELGLKVFCVGDPNEVF